ncbi:retrovirus-related pol polyprotein from transposon TNT 1-94 [Tanacetum coccineum]
MLLMQAQENGAVLDEEELLFLAGEQGNTFDADVDNQPVQDLALNEDNIFQADECDAFDSDVDDEPTAQTIFMANLSSAGSTNPQAGPSNASILSEVHTLENAIDHSVTNQDEHEIHNEVQQSNVIDSTSVYMGNSNVIPYEQYLSVNNISVVPSCASSTLNNVCVSSGNDAFVPLDPIANELKIYKEQVAIYEQRAKFELTEREQRMDDQMHMLIQNRNKTEENLKKELHSVKLQLNSTMENNKIIEGTVTTLKQELKQKESKFLTDFSNLKHLNDKLENKLHSQDQSIQTVHMMLNPTQVYDQKTKTALGAQNPFYLRQAKKAQPALYDGDELLKPHHVPVIVPSSEEELELAEATRNKLHVKMNDSVCVEKRVNITPPNYSKENFMATFTPQTQLTPEQDFEKTCKKRITPTGITEGERGFEQTKRVEIPFFNLLKEHFEGIQKSLVTEVRAMKAVFENLEAEVDQNELDLLSDSKSRQYDRNKEKISRLTEKNSDADPTLDLKALVSQNKDLTAKLNALHDLNERFRAENAKVKQHYKELYDSIKITRAKTTDQNNSLLSEIENLKAQLKDNSKCVTIPDSKPKVLAPGRYPIDVEPIPPRLKKNREVHLHYIKHLKENVETLREIVEEAKVKRPLDTHLHLLAVTLHTLRESVELFTFVEPCETSTHNTPPQVEHQKINSTNAPGIPSTGVKGASAASRFVRTDNGTEFVNKDLIDYYENVGITHEKTVPRTPQQNGVVERRNRTLVEAARTMLIFSKAPLFLWAEVVATACYTQNRSLIHTLHDKTPYELVHDKKPDLLFLCIFGALCYPTNDSEDLGKLKAKADIGFFVGYAPNRKGYRIYNKRTRQIMETIHVTFDELTGKTAPVHSSSGLAPNLLTLRPISSGLVPNSAPAISYVPPTNKDLELLFQPMFDECFETPTGDHQRPPIPAAPTPAIPTGPSVSISFVHDAPSGSHSPSSLDHQFSLVHHGGAAEHSFEVNPFATTDHEPFVNVFALDPNYETSSSRVIMLTEANQSTQPHEHLRKWTDSHLLDNIIGNPSRPVFTQKQLATDALWCFTIQ